MKKRLSELLIVMACILTLAAAANAYDIRALSDMPFTEKITGISKNPETGIAVAVSSEANALYIIDTVSGIVVRNIPLDRSPSGIAIDTARNQAVISFEDGTLRFYDLNAYSFIREITTGKLIQSIAINKEKDSLYTGAANGLAVTDLETGEIIKEASLTGAVTGIALDTSAGILLAIMDGESRISVYDAETLRLVTVIETGGVLSGISVNPSTHIAIATNEPENSIMIISLLPYSGYPASGERISELSFYEQPGAVTIDPLSNIALVAHKGGIATVRLENPVPLINTLVPDSGRAGNPGFTLSIKGEKFVKDTKAIFGSTKLSTRLQGNTGLQADIPTPELQTPGNVDVSVISPQPGGGRSNTLTFKIYNPMPEVEYISPDTIYMDNLPVTVRVYGRNFLPSSEVIVNGEPYGARFISSILLETEIKPDDIKTPGKYPLVVMTPSPGTFTSGAAYLNVMENEPTDEETDTAAATVSTAPGAAAMKKRAPTTGTLTGRILNTQKEPVEGVTIKVKGISVTTDSDGYFMIKDVPSGRRVVLINGATARDKERHYPTIPLTVDISAGMINRIPFQVYLHRQKDWNFKKINPLKETILTDPEVPGFEMRIPKGVNITGWDGKPNRRVSVRTVPVNRLPIKPLPASAGVRTVYMFYFDKVGGGIPDSPIPIKSKNDLGLLPGEKAVLWYYDESPEEGEAPNDWVIAGAGTVTPDGKYIVSDPGVGIPKFCCGATAWGGAGEGAESTAPGDPNGPCPTAGDPVDLATGYFLHKKTDMRIPGIIPVNITRYYRTGDSGAGAFGTGTYFEYDWWLGDYDSDEDGIVDMYLLIKPGNYQFRFDTKQADGTFINETDPSVQGAAVTENADSTKTLRMKNGWTYTFDESGNLTAIADRNGNALTFTRRSDFEGGYLTAITTPEGRTVTFNQTYTGNFHRTDSITDSTGRTVTYTYEDDPFSNYPRLIKVTYNDGSFMEYQYDSSGRMSGIINERGILEVTNEYDDEDRVITQTHIDGGAYAFNYTTAGGNIVETTMTAPNGAETTWGFYDYETRSTFSDKYITYKTTPDGTTIYNREPGTNFLLSVTDPLGREMTYTYYPDGSIETKTDHLGNVTSYEYEPVYSLPSKITDALQKTTTITYTYDAEEKITQIEIQDPLLNSATINFNATGMPTGITDPNLNTTTLLYENTGKPAELTGITDMLGNTRTYGYDDLGRLTSITDAKGKTTYYTYNDMDRVTETEDALGRITRFSFGVTGNLLSVTDAENRTTRYEYDERDRLTKIRDQLGRETGFAYYTGAEISPATGDNLKSITDRKGQTTTFNEYDAMNRPKKITYHDSSYTEYTYDAGGRTDYINDSISSYIDITYSGFGCATCAGSGKDRIAQVVTPFGAIDYTYDNVGRRETMTVAGQAVVNYDYYDNGWIENIRQAIDGTERKFNFIYDNAGRRNKLNYFQGTATTPVTETSYTFDGADRLENIRHMQAGTIIEELLYEYDPNGNRTGFTRNAAQPFREEVSGATYNEANRMLTFNDKAIAYDENGNMTEVTNTCGTTNYTWDVRDRLVGIEGFNADCTDLTASFSYDALNRRIKKTINEASTEYLYDGFDIIQEIQSGVVTANYIRGLNIDEPLSRITSGGTTTIRNYMTDASGSVIGLVDDTGVMKTTYTYDPFGNTTVSGETTDNPFQYTGRENDGTGLYYYRARYYSPELQRFISEDPIGLAGGDVNLFAYVGNNPVMFIDPWGLLSFDENLQRRRNINSGVASRVTKSLAGFIVGKEVVKHLSKAGFGVTIGDIIRNRGSIATLGVTGTMVNFVATAAIKATLVGGAFYVGTEIGNYLGAYIDTLVDDGAIRESIWFGSDIPNTADPCKK